MSELNSSMKSKSSSLYRPWKRYFISLVLVIMYVLTSFYVCDSILFSWYSLICIATALFIVLEIIYSERYFRRLCCYDRIFCSIRDEKGRQRNRPIAEIQEELLKSTQTKVYSFLRDFLKDSTNQASIFGYVSPEGSARNYRLTNCAIELNYSIRTLYYPLVIIFLAILIFQAQMQQLTALNISPEDISITERLQEFVLGSKQLFQSGRSCWFALVLIGYFLFLFVDYLLAKYNERQLFSHMDNVKKYIGLINDEVLGTFKKASLVSRIENTEDSLKIIMRNLNSADESTRTLKDMLNELIEKASTVKPTNEEIVRLYTELLERKETSPELSTKSDSC